MFQSASLDHEFSIQRGVVSFAYLGMNENCMLPDQERMECGITFQQFIALVCDIDVHIGKMQ
jgi:hypothetical protein